MNRFLRTACTLAVVFFAVPAFAATYSRNASSSGNWNVASNWSTGTPANSSATSLYFGGASWSSTDNVAGSFSVNGMTFNNTGASTIYSSTATNALNLTPYAPPTELSPPWADRRMTNGWQYSIVDSILPRAHRSKPGTRSRVTLLLPLSPEETGRT